MIFLYWFILFLFLWVILYPVFFPIDEIDWKLYEVKT